MSGHRIVIGGLPYFGRMLADLLGDTGWRVRYAQMFPAPPWAPLVAAREIAAAELVYLIGGQVRRWSRPDCLLRIVRRPVVMHWTGSDVGFARAAADDDRLSQRLVGVPQHWAEVPWIADELRPLGIMAEVVPLTSTRMPRRVAPLPERFTVLSYLPHKRPDFYGQRTVMELAKALPDVPFLIAGNDGTGMHPPTNVEFLGWQTDMEPVYQRATVLLRQPEHDGLSFMVLEALAAGRYVIWNHPIGGAIEAQTPAESLACIRHLLTLHQRGALGLNEGGPVAVRAGYAAERVRDDLRARFERLITGES